MTQDQQVQLPRFLGLIAALGLLLWVNDKTNWRVVPATLGLVVLYAALTNVDRAQALIGSVVTSTQSAFHPARESRIVPGGHVVR